MRNKIFTRIIITTLLCAFLTFSVGKVTRVYAVGTTAAIAGTAFILTGAVYISYLALTQAEITLPASDVLSDWLGSIGKKVSQYPSGAEAYQDIYQGLLWGPIPNVIDDVWTWTEARLKSFVNDFSDTRVIQNILSFHKTVDVSQVATNGWNYGFSLVSQSNRILANGTWTTVDALIDRGWAFGPRPSGVDVVLHIANTSAGTIAPSTITDTVRNYMINDHTFRNQHLVNGQWVDFSPRIIYGGEALMHNGNVRYYAPYQNTLWADWVTQEGQFDMNMSIEQTYPLFPNAVIYDAANDRDLPMIIPQEEIEVITPQWLDPDNNNRPIIPWVPIPTIPDIPDPPTFTNPPSWGFPLQDLLDLLESLAETLIGIDAIARLINEFAGLHGDTYYLYYNDGDTNYYSYYQPTIFDNDTEYITYNIDITDEQDKIPVDLNTIQLYTDNRYLAQIKESAVNGSTMLRDLAVFWYDVDPEVTYIVFGSCILILIGAFTGKLGHS